MFSNYQAQTVLICPLLRTFESVLDLQQFSQQSLLKSQTISLNFNMQITLRKRDSNSDFSGCLFSISGTEFDRVYKSNICA